MSIEKVARPEEWWLSEPVELVRYLYWMKNKLPPTDEKTYNKEFDRIVKQMNDKFKCPEEFKEKWRL